MPQISKEEYEKTYVRPVSLDQGSQNLRSQFNFVRDFALNALIDNDGQVGPFAIIFSEDKRAAIVSPATFGTQSDKDQYALAIKLLAIKQRASAVAFISESWNFNGKSQKELDAFQAWRLSVSADTPFDEYPGPGVGELVVIALETREGVVSASLPITRAEDKKYVKEGDETLSFYTAESLTEKRLPLSGRFVGLLPPEALYKDPGATNAVDMLMAAFGLAAEEINLVDVPSEPITPN